MNKQNGFSLIEAMILASIIGIVIALWFDFDTKSKLVGETHNGVGGTRYTRCIEGYKFVVDYKTTTQIIDSNGHGIACEK